jgi:hypothetical protein
MVLVSKWHYRMALVSKWHHSVLSCGKAQVARASSTQTVAKEKLQTKKKKGKKETKPELALTAGRVESTAI